MRRVPGERSGLSSPPGPATGPTIRIQRQLGKLEFRYLTLGRSAAGVLPKKRCHFKRPWRHSVGNSRLQCCFFELGAVLPTSVSLGSPLALGPMNKIPINLWWIVCDVRPFRLESFKSLSDNHRRSTTTSLLSFQNAYRRTNMKLSGFHTRVAFAFSDGQSRSRPSR